MRRFSRFRSTAVLKFLLEALQVNLGRGEDGASWSIKKITLRGYTENDFPSRNSREMAFLLLSFSDLPRESDIYNP